MIIKKEELVHVAGESHLYNINFMPNEITDSFIKEYSSKHTQRDSFLKLMALVHACVFQIRNNKTEPNTKEFKDYVRWACDVIDDGSVDYYFNNYDHRLLDLI